MNRLTKHLATLGVALSVLTGGAYAFEHPGGLHTQSQISFTGQQIKANRAPWSAAWKQLLAIANASLDEVPSAVRYYEVPRYYANAEAHGAAKDRLREDTEAAYATALAYAIGSGLSDAQRKRFADKTVALLDNWATVNTGYDPDEDAPLVIAYTAPPMIHAAELIWGYSGWSDAQRSRFKKWANDIVRNAANRIKYRDNNWGTWGILAALSVDHLRDDNSAWQSDVTLLKKIIDQQIAGDGSMPREIGRGDSSLHYTAFALESLGAAVELVRNAGGPNLYQWTPGSGGSLRDGLDYLFERGIENPRLWPTSIRLDASSTGRASEIYQSMGLVYGVGKWLAWVEPPLFRGGTGLGFVAPTLMQAEPAEGLQLAVPGQPQITRVRVE